MKKKPSKPEPEGFTLLTYDLVPLEWVEKMYPPPSLVGRILVPKPK